MSLQAKEKKKKALYFYTLFSPKFSIIIFFFELGEGLQYLMS